MSADLIPEPPSTIKLRRVTKSEYVDKSHETIIKLSILRTTVNPTNKATPTAMIEGL